MIHHIRFWFLVRESELTDLSSKELVKLFQETAVESHTPPTTDFDGWCIFSTRLAPPDIRSWRDHHVHIIGITGGMDDMPPFPILALTAREAA